MSLSSQFTDFRYSFSGADANVYAWFAGQNILAEEIGAKIKEFDDYVDFLKSGQAYKLAEKQEAKLKGLTEKLSKSKGKDRKPIQASVDKLKRKMERSGTAGLVNNVDSDVVYAIKQKENLEKIRTAFTSGAGTHLESMSTISISIHEPKGMVRRMGHRNIVGLTRSTRTIAGTMIFTIIDKHPLSGLMALDPQTVKKDSLKWFADQDLGTGVLNPNTRQQLAKIDWVRTPTDLGPFNMLFEYMSEYPSFSGNLNLASNQDASNKSALSELNTAIKETSKRTSKLERDIRSSKKTKPMTDNQKEALIRMEAELKTLREGRKNFEKLRSQLIAKGNSLKSSSRIAAQKATMVLENVEFISSGTVTSVNDMVSEISFQFVAGNIYELFVPGQDRLSSFPELAKILSDLSQAKENAEARESRINGSIATANAYEEQQKQKAATKRAKSEALRRDSASEVRMLRKTTHHCSIVEMPSVNLDEQTPSEPEYLPGLDDPSKHSGSDGIGP